jgi:succinate dehydrogenase / fumarate reductase, flavoprotein subunit
MLGDDKTRLMSEASRGEGGRIWVPKDPKDQRPPKQIPETDRFYFLEEWYPAYGNTVPRDVASRAIWKAVKDMGLGVGGEDKVYLDVSHLPRDFVERRLGAILEIYRSFAGKDPCEEPMEIFPAVHYSMGGIWVDWEKDEQTGGMKYGSARNHQTNIPGLFACGECDGAYHGANRLGANSLLSASFSGRVAGEAVATYVKGLGRSASGTPSSHLDEEKRRQESINREITSSSGTENVYALHRELGDLMTEKVGVVRHNPELDKAIEGVRSLKERFRNISLDEKSTWANASLPYARQVHDMIVLAEVIAVSARARDEFRGAHYKPEFELEVPKGKFPGDPEYDAYVQKWKVENEKWLKTTVASYANGEVSLRFDPVDISVFPPEQPRDYR